MKKALMFLMFAAINVANSYAFQVQSDKAKEKKTIVNKATKKLNPKSALTAKKEYSPKQFKKGIVQHSKSSSKTLDSVNKLRNRYSFVLSHHPMRKSMKLTKGDRKKLCLTPNKYYEQEWLYTMNPVSERPEPEEVLKLQAKLDEVQLANKAPGEDISNPWEERGPNNVGGRTRVLKFAPGSLTRVFAGGVSGGLWVNNDITNAASQWQRVNGVPSNMAVSCMTIDPNNNQIMYIGTGEVYTWGSVNGNGVYKSTDGGNNWVQIFGAPGANVQNNFVYIQDIVAWNNPVTNQTEVYFGADAMNYSEAVAAGPGWAWLGLNTTGLYKSTNGGNNFVRQNLAVLKNAANQFYAPNKFAVGSDNKLWMGTKYSYPTGALGGMLFSTTDGAAWNLVRDFGTRGRVEIVASRQTANKLYVLLEDRVSATKARVKVTNDGFVANNVDVTNMTSIGRQPAPASDFTRGQSFYDLMIGIDPNDDRIVYVAGIEIFKTTNSGTAWTQLTDWTGNNGTLDGVHSDHHCMAFANSNRMVFGCDGGVYYSNDSGTTITARNSGYNVTQFYKASINQTGANQKLLAGAQDNGTQLINNAPAGISGSAEINGGDGCWNFIDTGDQFMISSYVYNVYSYHDMNGNWIYDIDNDLNTGDFVNQCGLDSANNILYTNGTNGATYQIKRHTLGAASVTATTTISNALLNNIPTFFRNDPNTPTTLFVGTATGRLLRVRNANGGAPVWASIGDASWVGAISDIRIGATSNDIFVTFHNYGVVSVWYSADGGTTWQNKEGDLPNMPVKCILQNPLNLNEVIVGTELGVWRTSNFSNAAPNWFRSYNGMSDVKVLSFDYRATDRTILAGTFGRGMFTGKFWVCGDVTTTWNGAAWSNGAPDKTKAVIMNGNYNTAVNGSFETCSMTVNSNFTVNVAANNYIQITTDLTVNANATLTIANTGSLVMLEDTGVVTNNGTINVQKTTSNLEKFDYVYWSSPVQNITVASVFSAWVNSRTYSYNGANFSDLTGPTGTGAPDGFDDNKDDWQLAAQSSVLGQGKGYAVMAPTSGVFPRTESVTFTGKINNGVISLPLTLSANAANANDDWNLVGNPYPSSIKANDFINLNTNISGTLYFWTHVENISGTNPGPDVLNFSPRDYAMYNLSGGTQSLSNSAVPNGFIASGQSFFVEAVTATNVTFNNSLRSKDYSNSQFFRTKNPNSSVDVKDRFWINLKDKNGAFSQQLIGYFKEASNAFDRGYDGIKPLIGNTVSFYSILDNEHYGIQGKGEFTAEDSVKLGYNVTSRGDYYIDLTSKEGIFDTQDVYLLDKTTGFTYNLKNGQYNFSSEAGNFEDRFEIVYKPVTQSLNIVKGIVIYPVNNSINVKSSESKIESITVYDVLGKNIFSKEGINQNDYSFSNIIRTNSVKIVTVILQNGETVTKKIVY